ncbi:hypothetical protein GPECTOR_81g229 [Gonium pectorale]|uniref:Uncharacterized protein n=1 Tax=Gonium pectorale TaxID=33097 RepID=A0A150G1M5_GONPE|nr:hypothetical protein GPECTOR_81g229 [Gonium pectorale]|eukprot:KXZ43779.1 hypothetical protein GPECTOR_81g229 [Gonium pectorale]
MDMRIRNRLGEERLDGPGSALAAHQVSLLDLLRLLRQRRRTDTAAAAFAGEQLRLAASNVTQIVFGLRSSERLLATATCALTAQPVMLPPLAAPAAAAPAAGGGGSSYGNVFGYSSLYGGLPFTWFGREGSLYVTSRVLGFSTLLLGDLKANHDVTFKLPLKDSGQKAT